MLKKITEPMRQGPTILQTTLLAAEHSAKFLRMEELQLRFSNGVLRDYRRIVNSKRGAVMIVALVEPESVLLIREYAAGTEQYELVLPKGQVDAGESFEQAALRELAEETGFGARHIRPLKAFTMAPTFMGQVTHSYVASGLYPHRLEGDEPEELEVIAWPLAELEQLIARGDCTEARSIAALLLVRAQLQSAEGQIYHE